MAYLLKLVQYSRESVTVQRAMRGPFDTLTSNNTDRNPDIYIVYYKELSCTATDVPHRLKSYPALELAYFTD